ncbi:MAG: NAD(P)-binding domain-containing protein, partial [Clostridiales bacterium]|nr:NAD(P)-binding domain-containing protein [Clostridiales bacterium]
LLDAGLAVRSFAQPAELLPEGAVFCETLRQAICGADALVLPMPGVKNDGSIYSAYGFKSLLKEKDISLLKAGAPVLVGIASSYLQGLSEKLGLRLLAMADRDEVAVPNAIPTAEGAIAVAMEQSREVLFGKKALLLGFGRVSEALAPRLRAFGMEVVIANRGLQRRQKAREAGFFTAEWEDWPQLGREADFIFNTVPALLLSAAVLLNLSKHTIIIDLAANPGGTDFGAAASLGLRAVLASGLPGRVAPVTAGKTLAAVYPPLIISMCHKREG